MKKHYFFIIIAIVFNSTLYAQPKKIIFADEFTDNSKKWEQNNTPKVLLALHNGAYIFEHKRHNGAWASSKEIIFDQNKNFTIKSTIIKKTGVNNSGYGLTWGWHNPMNYNVFLISGNGQYQVGENVDGIYTEIIGWTNSPHINKLNSANTLVIKKKGQSIFFIINKNVVDQIPYKFFKGTKTGFFINKNIRLRIENIFLFNGSRKKEMPNNRYNHYNDSQLTENKTNKQIEPTNDNKKKEEIVTQNTNKTKIEVNKESDVDINIPKTNTNGSNTLAIIIGIENYKYSPKVDFAENDAKTFYQYARNVFQIPEKNIYLRLNDGATSGEFNKAFFEDGWLARRIKAEETDIIIYYAGHGAPDIKSKQAFLIPYDIDPNYASTGYSLDKLYTSLSALKAKSITVFIDACFSGTSRKNEALIAGNRSVKIKPSNPVNIASNISIFTASENNQYSSAYPEKYHGLFTYFLLKGLQGNALSGKTKTLSVKNLFDYVKQNVTQAAGHLDKEQTPTLLGVDKAKILVKY